MAQDLAGARDILESFEGAIGQISAWRSSKILLGDCKLRFHVSHRDFKELMRVAAPDAWSESFVVKDGQSQNVWLSDGPYAVFADSARPQGQAVLMVTSRDKPPAAI